MKTLTLARHAKSSWDIDGLDDFDRPLNNRGLRDSINMGERLLARGYVPQHIVSSPALRAITTAQRLSQAMQMTEQAITTEATIYEASSDRLYDCIWGLDERYEDIMLVGHNPGMSVLAESLLTTSIAPFVTCAMARLSFDCQGWSEIIPNSARLEFSDYPKSEQ